MFNVAFISMLSIISGFSLQSQGLQFITDHLGESIEWQDIKVRKVYNKIEAEQRLNRFLGGPMEYNINRVHDPKLDIGSDTYGIAELEHDNGNLRIFYYCAIQSNRKYKIVKIKITEN